MIIPEIDNQFKNWMETLMGSNKDISTLYTEKALLFSESDSYIQGVSNITAFYQSKFEGLMIKEYYSLHRVQLSENEDMVFEIGLLTTAQNINYQYLILWTRVNGAWLRDLEVVAKKEVDLENDRGIDVARKQWVEFANQHSAITLAKNTYIENLFYYNRGILYQGYESLAEVYSYMNDLSFHVDLKSEYSVMVGQTLAYEIGVWSAYGTEGHYIIIWKKIDSEWKIMLDCNW